MAENNKNEVKQDKTSDEELISVVTNLDISEQTRLNDFIELAKQIKAKQDALDIMAADSTPSAIASSYVADTLEPNSQGDLVTLVAKDPGNQVIIDTIYKRLNLPLEKIVYSLFKNAIVLGEFAHEGDVQSSSKAANEGVEKSSTEDILIRVNNSRIVPKLKILTDTTRVFPILQYEEVIGFIEVTVDDWTNFNYENDYLSYKDVVIHSAEDYAYVKFGFRTESKPVQLRVRNEDGTVSEYDIDMGRSLLEAAYPAWQTLSILKDSINLARLSHSASSVLVQTEVGNMSEAGIELAKNKLKDLFENRLAFGRNGAKSYLQPQIKPNYVYSFTKNGVGAITLNTVGGEYNPGALQDLKYFEDEFFGTLGAPKQFYARTSDSAGLDGGGAVEQYEKRYKGLVAQFKRLLAKFIKECINRVLLSRGLTGVYDDFDVIVNKAYEEDDMQIVNLQQTKLSFLQQALEFMEIQDLKKVQELKLQILKTVITDKTLLESFSSAILEEKNPSSTGEETNTTDNGDLGEDDFGSGGGGGVMDEISNIGTPEDLSDDSFEEIPSEGEEEGGGEEVTEEGGEEELPPVSELVDEGSIDDNGENS